MNNLILIGFKGAGKTTLGRKVAAELKKPFIDTDDLFEEPPAILYKKIGEKAFRAREKELLQTLKGITGRVIATGAGIVLNPENRIFLLNLGLVVHLHTPKTMIEQRIGCDHHFWSEYDYRLGIYTQIAHHSVVTEDELWEVIRLDPFFK